MVFFLEDIVEKGVLTVCGIILKASEKYYWDETENALSKDRQKRTAIRRFFLSN